MDWHSDLTKHGAAKAVLYDGQKVVATIYISRDREVLRIVLPEFTDSKQLSFKPGGILDFKRKVE